MNIVLCTINPSVELAWREALVDFPALHPLCEILTGNITELAVDAVVSPANSFGFPWGHRNAGLPRHGDGDRTPPFYLCGKGHARRHP